MDRRRAGCAAAGIRRWLCQLVQPEPGLLLGDVPGFPRVSHTDDPMHITRGHGDLERDLLPHFLVRLPCDATAVRYGEWEDIGPDGWLALRFETSPSCLDAFVRENGLKSAPADPIPAYQVPQTYGWDLTTTAYYYSAEPSTRVRLSVAVDNRSSRPTVYAWSAYH